MQSFTMASAGGDLLNSSNDLTMKITLDCFILTLSSSPGVEFSGRDHTRHV
jgi:hypothetical protein